MPASGGGSASFDADAFADVGQAGRDGRELDLFGLGVGQSRELTWQFTDAAGLVVISARDCVANPLLMSPQRHRSRAFPA
jgi:hypothetical protein